MVTRRLRFIKSLFPYNDNPGVKLLLYEVEQIQKYINITVSTKVPRAPQPAPSQASATTTAPSPTTPAPIKTEEDEPTTSTAAAKVAKGPPVPKIVVTTPGGFIVSIEEMPAWKQIESPSRFRGGKQQRDGNEWLSPPSMYSRKLRKKTMRRQMHNISRDAPSPDEII